MATPPLLWLDFRQRRQDAGHFPLLLTTWSATRIARPPDPAAAILEWKPRFLCFEFDLPAADELATLQQTRLQHPSLPMLVLSDKLSAAFTEQMSRLGIWDCLINPVSASELNACVEAFAHFCQQRRLGALPDTSPCKPTRQPRTQAACEYVAQHYASEVRLNVVASLCHLSESEFSRCFKKENSVTFSEYLMHLRLRKARDLLAEPAMQVKNVAFEVGFNDVSYFARAFRRHTGITPSDYQRNAGIGYHATPAITGFPDAMRPPA